MRIPSREDSSRTSEMPSSFLVCTKFGNALDQPRFVHLVWDFCDDDALAVFGGLFNRGFGAHGKAAAAVFVSGFDAIAPRDVCPCRESPVPAQSS